MAKKEEKKNYAKLRIIAEGLFVSQGLTAREIAETLDISEVTISKWRQGDDGQSWDDKKDFIRLTPSRLRSKLLSAAEKMSSGEESDINAGNAGVIVKLLSAAEKLGAKASPEVVHSVLKEYSLFVAGINPDDAITIAEYSREFLQKKIEQES